VPSDESFVMLKQNLADFLDVILPHLDERQRRIVAGATAHALGHGGVKMPAPRCWPGWCCSLPA
jgi:hypothetical protein